MARDSAIRWAAVAVAAAAAIIIAVWSGMQQRPAASHDADDAGSAASAETTRELCASRLAKLGKALRLYADDHDGCFPVADTPARADRQLLPLLQEHGIAKQDFRCPARTEVPYAYHCYRSRGRADWPNWMVEEHVVAMDSAPDTWLMADCLLRGMTGPHSTTEKAFNYLCVDGRVEFHAGRPRGVYK